MSALPEKKVRFYLLALSVFLLVLVLVRSSILIHPNQPITPATAASTPTSPYVRTSGTSLVVNGEKYQFTGINAFHIATYPGYNAGCGSPVVNLDAFFSNIRTNSAIRLWAFQGSMAVNPETKKIDWAGLDRVINAAQKNNKKLILVLGDQSGHCDDGHWKDKAWYQSGYTKVTNDYGNGLTPLPYLDYVKAIVTRYKDVPAIAMWEPMNEPNASDCLTGKGYECYSHLACPNEATAASTLRAFFDTVGGAIKQIDTHHLVSSGTIGDGQCGTIFEDYAYVHQSAGIDVASYHDYQRENEAMPGDQWNGLPKRLAQMKIVNKPLIIGEVGMIASQNGSGCMSTTSRKDKMKAKMDAQYTAGIAGFLPWSLTDGSSNGCNYDIGASDPLLTLLKTYPVAMSGSVPTSSFIPFASPTPVQIDVTAPSNPTGLKSSGISSSQVALSWNAATDNVRVERYDIFRDFYYVSSTTGTSFTNSGLTAGKSYMYNVKAKDSSGNYSGESNRVTITTLAGSGPAPVTDTQAPSAPTGLTATSTTAGQVILHWTGATDNVKVDRYEVYRDYAYVTAVWGTTYTNINLTPGKTYLYYLKSRDTAGNSSGMSMKVSVTVK